MADTLKLLSQELTLSSTPNTVSSASVVRMVNLSNTAAVLVTQRNAENTVLGSLSLNFAGSDNSCIVLIKKPTDTLEANGNTVVATSVGYF